MNRIGIDRGDDRDIKGISWVPETIWRMMSGIIFVAPNEHGPVASWAFHWVAEFLADNLEDLEAVD
jgi:hypothetical protein